MVEKAYSKEQTNDISISLEHLQCIAPFWSEPCTKVYLNSTHFHQTSLYMEYSLNCSSYN